MNGSGYLKINMICYESGICSETAFVANTVNVSKPRQKHEIRQNSKM